ncbi:MAG: hypothetical protein IKF99_08605 [Oscillospiraceae bacterium]|nr:hypothetical protein [Oscillospiraceae bacterium]
MKVATFLARLKEAEAAKTLYVNGCFGAPLTAANKTRYTKNTTYNKQPARTAKINAASADTFGFDCVCLIKGILWGWTGDKSAQYGGAVYKSNGVPDFSATAAISYCTNATANFAGIVPGALLWMSGHVGIYIGNGLAIECTPSWDDGVQITAVGNIGKVWGYNTRTWKMWGLLPWIDYAAEEQLPAGVQLVDMDVKSPKVSGTVKVPAINLGGRWYVQLRAFDDIMGIASVDYDAGKKRPKIID